jgi:hypothetical protein
LQTHTSSHTHTYIHIPTDKYLLKSKQEIELAPFRELAAVENRRGLADECGSTTHRHPVSLVLVFRIHGLFFDLKLAWPVKYFVAAQVGALAQVGTLASRVAATHAPFKATPLIVFSSELLLVTSFVRQKHFIFHLHLLLVLAALSLYALLLHRFSNVSELSGSLAQICKIWNGY